MIALIAFALWIGTAYLLYVGLRARLLPHQSSWQAAAMVGILCSLLIAGVALTYWASQRPNYGVEDGGEEYRSGRPEAL